MSQRIAGIRKLKTARRAKLRSKPKIEGQEYLELYLMTKEKERLQRYHEVISDTREITEDEIKDAEKEFGKLKKRVGIAELDSQTDVKATVSDGPQHKKRKPIRPMKTVVIDY